MLGYHLRLALHSATRDKLGTLLAVLAIGLGIGAVATMATLLGELTRDPLPGRSGELFHPHLDASPPGFAAAAGNGFDAGESMTWLDAHNVLRAGMAPSQAIMAGGRARLDAGTSSAPPFTTQGRYATAQFFALFGVPFQRGSGWTVLDDDAGARVVVLSQRMAARLFGAREAVGRLVRIEGTAFRVVGVASAWQPVPLFYGGSGGDAAYREDDFFLPLQAAIDLPLPFAGGMACWDGSARTGDGCAWLQFWVRLPAGSAGRYRDFLVAYASGQRANGRHLRVEANSLSSVRERLRQLRVVPREVLVQCGLALAFFGICLIDIAGLLLARFLARERDVGIRRALGATRGQVFQRFAVEAALLGLAGGGAGIAFAQAGLWLVRRRPDAYAALAHMHAGALLAALGASLLSTIAAGAIPAWRACGVPPAANLRSA